MRYFTLEEANRALVLIRPIVCDIAEKRRRLAMLDRSLRLMREKRGTGPEGIRWQRTEIEFRKLIEQLQYHVDEVAQIGCALRDSARGTIDFPSWFRGQEVFLCWQLGDKEVLYWHEPGEGYAKRQSIDTTFRTNPALLPT